MALMLYPWSARFLGQQPLATLTIPATDQRLWAARAASVAREEAPCTAESAFEGAHAVLGKCDLQTGTPSNVATLATQQAPSATTVARIARVAAPCTAEFAFDGAHAARGKCDFRTGTPC
jgi:hypothetical protein